MQTESKHYLLAAGILAFLVLSFVLESAWGGDLPISQGIVAD